MDAMKTSSCQDDLNKLSSSSSKIHRKNVLLLLARREIAPRISKGLPRRKWGETSKQNHQSSVKPQSEIARDSRRELHSWLEAESLRGLTAKYCPLEPSPRSTIAAAFSSDGKILASTHGDHTVKIIDCQTGKCQKVLSGHRRTPWVVRFHPLRPEILASGSLDHEVRLWNANTSECTGSRDFYRPIASIAFHSEGELLAVAAGHKLYLWQYDSRGETSPTIVLRTRRSLRAVHFHPHAAPFLLTAEVNDLDSSDSAMAPATSLGYLHYPPPAVYMSNINPIDGLFSRPAESPGQLLFHASATGQYEQRMVSLSSSIPISNTNNTVNDNLASQNHHVCDMQISPYGNSSGASDLQLPEGYQQNLVSNMDISGADISQDLLRDQINWELPFMQGWLMGPNQSGNEETNLTTLASEAAIANRQSPEASLVMQNQVNQERPVLQDFSSRATSTSAQEYRQNALINETNDGTDSFPIISRIQSQLTASLTATAAELPCTVKLRIWPHDSKNPCASLKAERCRLTIPHAVLCSEMGAHFSPCGRYLAACVACVLPQFEADTGIPTQLHQEVMGGATSPTRHPISARQVMYELRIYSLEEATFGSVLISRPIRAAHCLTSIQFSPTSEHILLAYGRRHSSLLKSIVINGEMSISIYTVLEVYRVSDMKLVSVLPSAEDEVNVACFHPLAGGGLVYGTKEGKLRVLQYKGANGMNKTKSDHLFEAHMVEVQTYALEC